MRENVGYKNDKIAIRIFPVASDYQTWI